MSKHALLSPSAAHRWLNCPLAPRLEATLPDSTSDYAKEGTLAHSACEITARKHFKQVKSAEYNKVIKRLKGDPLWNDEMLTTADIYVEHIAERAMGFEFEPYLAFEVRVDITEYVPEAFGTCDCVIVGGSSLVITDYKHGKGVPVSPQENPQLMLYALGALKLYRPIYGDTIQNIKIFIDQPRLNSYDGWECTVKDLLDWGGMIKPKAEQAFAGIGEYHTGDWCRFCRANGTCKAQADSQTSAFDDFRDVINGGQVSPGLLSPESLGAVLERGKNLVEWYESVKAKVLEKLLGGEAIPGWKAVEGKSARVWTNQDKALEALMASGIDRAVIYDNVPKTLAQLEKLLGTAKFSEVAGNYITKPQGKPALAPESDARAAFNGAATDFAGVIANG